MSENALFIPLAAEGLAPNTNRGWVQLARTTGGIAKNGDRKFEITTADITAYAAHIKANPGRIPIDYDHSYAEGAGTRAAGWIDASTVEARADGNELWAMVDWTPAAADAIRAGEFRFFSPEISFQSRKDGVLRKAAEFLAGALTNRPFFKDMSPVSLSEAHKLDNDQGDPMSKVIATSLGLAEDADEKSILAALKTRDDAVAAAEKKATDAAEALTAAQKELDELKATASDADKKVAELSTTVAGLLKANHEARLATVLDKAVTATKMDPAERDAMTTLADKAGVEAVEALLNARPERPLNRGKGGGGEAPSDVKLTVTISGDEVPVDPESAELAAKVDAYILGLKLDREPTADDYLRATEAVLRLAA